MGDIKLRGHSVSRRCEVHSRATLPQYDGCPYKKGEYEYRDGGMI